MPAAPSPDRHDAIDAELGREASDLDVGVVTPVAELEHLAEDGDASGRPPMPRQGARSAAAIDSGLALYASSMTTSPSSRTCRAIRMGERACAWSRRSATAAGRVRAARAAVAAAAALDA